MSIGWEYSPWARRRRRRRRRSINDPVLVEMVAERTCRTRYIHACWQIIGSQKEDFLEKISHSQVRCIVKINNNL